jgi:hypothetical protein
MEWSIKQMVLGMMMFGIGMVVKDSWLALLWVSAVYLVMIGLLLGMLWFGWLGVQALRKQHYQLMSNCFVGLWCCIGATMVLSRLVG